MAETDIEKVIAEFMAKLKPVSEYTPEERAAAKAKWEKDETEKAARKAKWPEIEKCKGEMIIKGIANTDPKKNVIILIFQNDQV